MVMKKAHVTSKNIPSASRKESPNNTIIWHVSDPYPRGGGVINGVGPGGQVMVPAVDEVPPPPYQSVAGGAPMVSCRVCQVSREKRSPPQNFPSANLEIQLANSFIDGLSILTNCRC